MKRILNLLCCLLLTAALAMTAMADGGLGVSATVNNTAPNRGGQIEVVVSVSAGEGMSGGLQVTYGEASLELISGTMLLSGTTISNFSVTEKNGVFVYSESQTISGEVLKLVFKVKDDAPFSATNIQVSAKIQDQTEQTQQTAQTNVSVTVVCAHSFAGWISDGEHTHTHTCTICNGVETVEHTWNEGEITTAATCSAEGVRTHTCTGCGATKNAIAEKIAHKYSNSCDPTCNRCGAEREVTHKYSSKWTSDETGHWHTCSVCGSKKDEASHKPGAEPTEQTSQNCTVCGYIIKPALGHAHDYSLDWTSDETGHWHACSGCVNPGDYSEHQYENSCDKDCDICGYERETEHIYYENFLSNEDGHWHECRVCSYQLEMEHHTPNQDGMCTGCGYKAAASGHSHSYGDTWDWNATGHWQSCQCGENSDIQPHSWDEGEITKKPTDTEDGGRTYTCTVCGAQRTELIPMGTVITDSFPWVVVLIVGGVEILGVVIYVVIGVAASKKKSGRFSNETRSEELETIEE